MPQQRYEPCPIGQALTQGYFVGGQIKGWHTIVIALLGGSWYSVNTSDWAYEPTSNWAKLCKASWGDHK